MTKLGDAPWNHFRIILLRNPPLHVKTLDFQIEPLVETPQKKESLKHLFSKMISYMLRKYY